jgi:hypothetical protein
MLPLPELAGCPFQRTVNIESRQCCVECYPTQCFRSPIGYDLSSDQPKRSKQGIVKSSGAPEIGGADGYVAKQTVAPAEIL